MDQLTDFSDSRNKGICVHCGEWPAPDDLSADHVPTKALLKPPHPENVPMVDVCRQCNSGFSRDEEYFVAFLACAISGTINLDADQFPVAARILNHSPRLRKRIDLAKQVQWTLDGNREIQWSPDLERVRRVVVKNGRGHIYYELGEPILYPPSHVGISPIPLLSDERWAQFNDVPHDGLWPEVGCRIM